MTRVKPARRLFVAPPLAEGASFDLTEAQAHYIGHVMRLTVGDDIAVFNGRDGEWRAVVSHLRKARCSLRVLERLRPQVREPDLWLAFAPLKRTRIDLLAEKAGELGAAVLWPVITARTNAERVNTERLMSIAIEAAQQCGRMTVAEVREPATLTKVLDQWPQSRRLFVLDESGAGLPIAAALQKHGDESCGFLIGPEGGFAPEEAAQWRRLSFVTAIGLGPRLLRAETAAMAALACWQALAGDWR